MPITIIKTRAGHFRVRITAPNGELLFHGEAVTTKQSAKKQIRAARTELFRYEYLKGLVVTDKTGKEEKNIWV